MAITIPFEPLPEMSKMPLSDRETCRHLFDLPQEILDMIFGLAYPEKGVLNIISRMQWVERQEDIYLNADGKYDQPFPDSKVAEFLGLGRKFFDHALRAYLRRRKLDWLSVRCCTESRDQGESVLPKFTTTLIVDMSYTTLAPAALEAFPRLRKLEVIVNPRLYKDLAPLDARKTLLTDYDLLKSEYFNSAKQLRGLQTHVLVPDDFSLRRLSAEDAVTWKANVSKLEAMLAPIVTQPKPKVISEPKQLQRSQSPLRRNARAVTSLIKESEPFRSPSRPFQPEKAGHTTSDMLEAFSDDPNGFLSWVRTIRAENERLKAPRSQEPDGVQGRPANGQDGQLSRNNTMRSGEFNSAYGTFPGTTEIVSAAAKDVIDLTMSDEDA